MQNATLCTIERWAENIAFMIATYLKRRKSFSVEVNAKPKETVQTVIKNVLFRSIWGSLQA